MQLQLQKPKRWRNEWVELSSIEEHSNNFLEFNHYLQLNNPNSIKAAFYLLKSCDD